MHLSLQLFNRTIYSELSSEDSDIYAQRVREIIPSLRYGLSYAKIQSPKYNQLIYIYIYISLVALHSKIKAYYFVIMSNNFLLNSY